MQDAAKKNKSRDLIQVLHFEGIPTWTFQVHENGDQSVTPIEWSFGFVGLAKRGIVYIGGFSGMASSTK